MGFETEFKVAVSHAFADIWGARNIRRITAPVMIAGEYLIDEGVDDAQAKKLVAKKLESLAIAIAETMDTLSVAMKDINTAARALSGDISSWSKCDCGEKCEQCDPALRHND